MVDDSNSQQAGQSSSPQFDEELLLQRLLASWRDGEGQTVEQLLAEHGPCAMAEIPADDLMLLICGEIALRRAMGLRVTLAEYQVRFPSLTETLAIQWQIDRWIDGESTLIAGSETNADVRDKSHDNSAHNQQPHANQTRLSHIGRYEIRQELGRGAMGVVYAAWDPQLGRDVAIKRLGASFAGRVEGASRLRSEAKAVAKLNHPHIVKVYDVGEDDELPFLAMELCRGGTLGQRLCGCPLPRNIVAQLMLTISEAVAEAHAKRIIHRDLKPGNILLDQPDQWHPKVSDFGLAKWLDSEGSQTVSGAIIGTPAYMAPEQARGDAAAVAETTDVYALGAILYECLTGRAPFAGDSAGKLLEQVARVEPLSIRRLDPSVPQELETIVEKCMRKDPTGRYPSARALADDLRRFIEHRPILARRPSPLAIARHWCRRNPTIASLCTAVCLLVVLSLSVLSWMNFRLTDEYNKKSRALNDLTIALQDKERLLAERGQLLLASSRSESTARQRYYNSQISLAAQAMRLGSMARAEDLLGSISSPTWDNFQGFESNWLRKSLFSDLLVEFSGIQGEITSLDFSPQGRYLLAASGDLDFGFIKLLDLKTGSSRHSREMSSMVNGVAYCPDGSLAVSVQGNGELSVLDPLTLEVRQFANSNLHCKSVCWTGDSKYFAVGTEDGYLSLWSADGPTMLEKVKAHQGPILRVFPARDSKHIYTSVDWGGEGRCSCHWAHADGQLTLVRKFSDISLCDESPDGQSVVGVEWGDIVIRDKTSSDKRSHKLSTGPLVTVKYDRSGALLVASPRNDRELKTLSVSSLEVLDRLPSRSPINATAMDNERGSWAIGDSHGNVRVWRKGRNDAHSLVNLDLTCTYVACLENSHDVLLGTTAGTWTWNPLTGQLNSLHAASNVKTASKDGKTMVSYDPAASAAGQPVLEVWRSGETAPRKLELEHAIYQDCLLVSPQGSWLATRSDGSSIRLISLIDESAPERQFEGHCFSFSISQDEQFLLGGAQYGRLPLFRLADGTPLPLKEEFESMWAWGMKTAFSPDGEYFACGNESGLVRVWKQDNLELVAQLSGNEGEIHSLAFFPDGRRLLVGGVGNPRLWDFVASQELLELSMDGSRAQMLDVSFDGTFIVALDPDGKIYVWNSRAARE